MQSASSASPPRHDVLPGPAVYMQKLVVPGYAAAAVDLDAPIADNLTKIAKATDRTVPDLTVCVLDRPRHADLVAAIRSAGADQVPPRQGCRRFDYGDHPRDWC